MFGQNLHICDAVEAIVADAVVLVVVADQVILALFGDELIGIHDVFAHLAILAAALVELLVRLVFKVMKAHLLPFVDRLVQQLDIVEKLFVIGLIFRHTGYVLHARFKVDIGQPRELFHQFHILLVGDVVREQHAVDQQPQLAVSEFPLQMKIGENDVFLFFAVLILDDANALAVIDIIAELDQVHQVALDCLPVDLHIVFPR